MLLSFLIPHSSFLYFNAPYRHRMAYASSQYKQVPYGMHVLNLLEGIEYCSDCIE